MVEASKILGRLGNNLFQIAYLYAQMKEGKIPDIYVQDTKYFEKYEKELRQLFGEGIKKTPYTSIHIRRGDYVNNPFYTDLSKTDYYENTISLCTPETKFLVFSDDPEFARAYFNDDTKFQIMEGGDEIEDFNSMASCEDNIIANSSFSLWAAVLNPNPNKKILAPIQTKYYIDGVVRTKFPKYFYQMDFDYV